MSFDHIKNQLGCYLHQDYDWDSGSVAKALYNAVATSNLEQLTAELEKLGHEDDEFIKVILGKHDILIWNMVTPRELHSFLVALCKLCRGESDKNRFERLLNLKTLYEKGLVLPSEYESCRKALLNRNEPEPA